MDSSTSHIVTIGFCVKNMAETVGKAINSIGSQDFPHDLLKLLWWRVLVAMKRYLL